MQDRDETTRLDALDKAMVEYNAGDTRRIDHAHKVTAYAKELREKEGGDYLIVVAAGLLHDIGIHQAEAKHGSASGKFQEIEGPPIAREIMTKLNFTLAQIDEVCAIVGNHHSPCKINTVNFKCLYDADWLVNLHDDFNITDKHKLASIIDSVLLTASGKTRAREIYL
jgi:predicted HD phosphohydrolase